MIEHIGGRTVVCSVSGGKDSAATSLYLREMGIEHIRVFADTGWENPRTYEYLRGPLAAALGPIVEVRNDLLFADLVRSKRIFPDRTKRFCTTELKVKPILAFIDAQVDDVVNVIGIRREESDARKNVREWEDSAALGVEVWRPICDWTLEDVKDIHARHGLSPNPLYQGGATRVGCWPCIHARQSEIVMVADQDPERITLMRDLEVEVTEAARGRAEDNGEPLRYIRAMFSIREGQKTLDAETGEMRRHHRPMPIDEAVEWARRGVARKTPEAPATSCGEWGFCES